MCVFINPIVKYLQIVVWIFLLKDIKVHCDSVTCNQENIERCWSYIKNSTIVTASIPYADRTELTDFCRRFDYFDQCTAPIRSQCFRTLPFYVAVTLEGQQNSYSYLCKESFEEYLSYQPCFDDAGLKMNLVKCNETLAQQIERLNNESDIVVATNKLCQTGQLYLGCIDNNLKVICNDGAANWANNFIKKVLSPLFSALPCPGWERAITTKSTGTDTATVALGVCLSMISVIILILLATLICCLKPQLLKSVPILRNVDSSKICFGTQDDNSYPPPYINSSSPELHSENREMDSQVTLQTGSSDFSLCSSGYCSTLERTLPDEKIDSPRSQHSQVLKHFMDARTNSTERISFDTSGVANQYKNARSNSADCMTVHSRSAKESHFLQHSTSVTPSQHSSTVTPTHFEPPTANPFTSLNKTTTQSEDPIITDYYC